EFQNDIDIRPLGLRLADARRYRLEEEPYPFTGYFAEDSIATPEERAFLQGGNRIELNAFTSPDFIQWLREKLAEHLKGRLIPKDDILADAYRRALALAKINKAIEEVHDDAIEEARDAEVPKSLRRKLQKSLKQKSQPWDKALYQLVRAEIDEEGDG